MMVNKKGKGAQGHVEIILSFVIFIGFLLVVFIFLNPFAKTQEVYFIGGIERAIIENISAEVGKLSVIIDDGISGCPNVEYDNFVIVQEGTSRKYTLYNGSIFTNSINCTNIDYTLGVFSKEDMIVYGKIEELKINYETGYNSLKQSFGVINGFSFSVKGVGGVDLITPSNLKKPPAGVEVEAKEIPMRAINQNGEILELIMNLRVW